MWKNSYRFLFVVILSKKDAILNYWPCFNVSVSHSLGYHFLQPFCICKENCLLISLKQVFPVVPQPKQKSKKFCKKKSNHLSHFLVNHYHSKKENSIIGHSSKMTSLPSTHQEALLYFLERASPALPDCAVIGRFYCFVTCICYFARRLWLSFWTSSSLTASKGRCEICCFYSVKYIIFLPHFHFI